MGVTVEGVGDALSATEQRSGVASTCTGPAALRTPRPRGRLCRRHERAQAVLRT